MTFGAPLFSDSTRLAVVRLERDKTGQRHWRVVCLVSTLQV